MAQADLAVSRLLSCLKRGDLAIMGKVVAIAVVAVIVVAGVSYFVGHGVLVTGDARSVANVALQSAGKHALDYDSVLKLTSSAPPLSASSSASFGQIKQAADSYVAREDQARAEIRSDRAGLRSADGALRATAQNPLMAPFRSNLDQPQRRVESMIAALDAADAGLGVQRDEMHATAAFMDVMSVYTTLGNREEAGDVAGSLAMFTTLDPKVQTMLQAVQPKDVPPHEVAISRAVAAVVADEKAVLMAKQAHDANRTKAALARFDTDSAAVDNVDTIQIDSEERAMLQPYVDRFEGNLKAAGFGLSG
ncbi:MAG TPA: hypothetical protein VKF59_15495 [Candidatus Dormibacteraeota bacterium]|nr:hypothetical protein [Candidatus Dormibacteraeota bacterium]